LGFVGSILKTKHFHKLPEYFGLFLKVFAK